MALDRGLLECTKVLLKSEFPEVVHIDDIYSHLEGNYAFSKSQLELHEPSGGGQTEPNWMHEIRNLLGPEKGKAIGQGTINPRKHFWSLPRPYSGPDFSVGEVFDSMVKHASKISRLDRHINCYHKKEGLRVTSYSPNKITLQPVKGGKEVNLSKTMVSKKLNHLANCGGSLELGDLHQWNFQESAIIQLCPILILDSGLVRII